MFLIFVRRSLTLEDWNTHLYMYNSHLIYFRYFLVFRLESSDLEGRDRRMDYNVSLLSPSSDAHVLGLDVYNYNIYWTDRNNRWTVRLNKSASVTKLAEKINPQPFGIKIYAKAKQCTYFCKFYQYLDKFQKMYLRSMRVFFEPMY